MRSALVADPGRDTRFATLHPDDLAAAADLHAVALPHGFFPTLGRRFLARYLATYLDDRDGVAIAAVVDGRLVGFLVGTTDTLSRRAHIVRRHGVRLAVTGLAALLARPRMAVRFLQTRAWRYVTAVVGGLHRRSGSTAAPVPLVRAVLSHVAVVPAARGTGLGAGLVHAFEREVRAAGCASAELLTRADEDGAGDFYRCLGWREEGGFDDRDGVRWTRFVRRLP